MSTKPDAQSMNDLRRVAAELTLDWARLIAPHYGPSGSLDLDLLDWPNAEGPSYYNQFSFHTLLQLSQGIVPGATPSERDQFRALALHNIEYCLGMTDAEFHTPHYSRGRDWGRHIGEWLNYYLLCALEIMEQDGIGSADIRDKMRVAIAGATDALYQRFLAKFAITPSEFVGNHDTWHALLFYRAGCYFKRREWQEYGQDFMSRCVLPFQSTDGYWPEAHGIVVGYSLVTALAVSVYSELSGDQAALAAIGKVIGFTDYFTFPDGSNAVVVDVRMRYHRRPMAFMPPGFLRNPNGVVLAMRNIRALRECLMESGIMDNGAQAFAFFGSFTEVLYAPRPNTVTVSDFSPKNIPAVRINRDGWVGYVGWQLAPEWGSNRFVLDSQNFLELWHAKAGYLAGTGNSKSMPRFSTVRRTSHGRAYVPDRALGRRINEHEALAEFDYGSDTVAVRMTITDGSCEIAARIIRHESGATYEFALLLAVEPDEVIDHSSTESTICPERLLNIKDEFQWRGIHWQLPAAANFEYPIVPHNSYTQNGMPKPSDYVARISFKLEPHEQSILIS